MKYKKILFIEDNKTKIDEVTKFLKNEFKETTITIKESFVSGLKELFTSEYDLLLLDMSLPVRDDEVLINDFMQLGGHRILSEMRRKKKIIPTILVTMYSEFNNGNSLLDIESVSNLINKNFSDFYLGYVYFSSQNISWQANLKKLILQSYEDIDS
jgi:CheY-like chemotaxis protein